MTLFDVADPGMERYATLSEDGLYRYTLHRRWNYDLPVLSWCCLNPSTANHLVDDNSTNRMIDFSRAFGYGGLDLFNIFGLISTDPAGLVAAEDPIGPDNDRYLLAIPAGEPLICAWGASVPHYWRHRPAVLVEQLRVKGVELHHLGLTKEGHPRHPLYLRGDTKPTRWAA